MICLYMIKNKTNGKYYVGSTKEFDKRIDRHIRELKQNNHHCFPLQDDYNRQGEGVFHIEYTEYENIEEARNVEQILLDSDYAQQYNISKYTRFGDILTYHPKRDEIITKISNTLKLNMSKLTEEERKEKFGRYGTDNGMYGKTHTDEVKLASSLRSKGNSYAKGSKRTEEQRERLSEIASQRVGDLNPFYGKKHTEESKELMRQANLGKKPPNMKRVSIDGNGYESVTEASRQLGVVPATIIHRIKSKNEKYKEYHYID